MRANREAQREEEDIAMKVATGVGDGILLNERAWFK